MAEIAIYRFFHFHTNFFPVDCHFDFDWDKPNTRRVDPIIAVVL